MEDGIEQSVRLLAEKRKSIGEKMLDRVTTLQRIMCRGQASVETWNDNTELILRSDAIDNRGSSRSPFSRYKDKPSTTHEVPEINQDLASILLLSPNRCDECNPSAWGYDSESLTDSQ